jgi:hypothetical protein
VAATEDPLLVARDTELLRQMQETFDQRKSQDRRWFNLRYAMGWVAVGLLPLICVISAYIIFNHSGFDSTTVALASGALLVDSLALVAAVWRLVLGKGPENLGPVTSAQLIQK